MESLSNYRIVRTLINNAGLPETEYLPIFQENEITDFNINHLDYDDVERLFEKHGRLPTCSFFNALCLWQKDNLTTIKKMKPSGGSLPYKEVKHLIDIKSILLGDIAGKQVIEFYQANQKLADIHRSKVIHLIINFILQSNIYVEKSEFEDITSKILKFFDMDSSQAVS